MRDDIEKDLKKAFEKQAEHEAYSMEPPDYLTDQAKEFQDEIWGQMDDDEKFNWAKDHDVLEGEEVGPSGATITDIQRPKELDPLGDESKHGKRTQDYKMTQALVRKMSIMRAAEIMRERKVNTGSYSPESAAMKIDGNIWAGWKGSSTSSNGKLLQLGIADELHGRLNYNQIGDKFEIANLRGPGTKTAFPGGYEAVKAYLRAKWETTQWLLDNAGMQRLKLYRGLKNIDQGKVQPIVKTTQKLGPGGENWDTTKTYNHLPELDLERNGAASTSANPTIANNWGSTVMRFHVPRTAVLSVPVYGQNEYGEQETVITGTAFKGWDVWQSPAPNLNEVPIMKQAS
jgi:hypothetical protein